MKVVKKAIFLAGLLFLTGCSGQPAPTGSAGESVGLTPSPLVTESGTPRETPSKTVEPSPSVSGKENSYAIVTEAKEAAGQREVTLDYVEVRWHAADNLDENGKEYGSDFVEVVNEKNQLQTFPVADEAEFFMSKDQNKVEESYQKVDWGFFKEHAAERWVEGETQLDPHYFIVEIQDGKLVKADHWYLYHIAG